MSGRRLLDAAAIFKASRAVAAKHLALRQHQVDNYNKTSSLAKAVKSQTDRITLTVKAASVLAARFSGPGPEYATQASQSEWIRQNVKNESDTATAEGKQGPEDSQSYKPPEGKTNVDESPSLGVKGKDEKGQTNHLPDGSTPSRTGDGTILQESLKEGSDALHFGTAQTALAEPTETTQLDESGRSNIPLPRRAGPFPPTEHTRRIRMISEKGSQPQSAKPFPTEASGPKITDAFELRVDQERDVFQTLSQSNREIMSALPTVKLPKNTEDAQESDEHVVDDQINQDVFYSSRSRDQEHTLPNSQCISDDEQEGLPEGANSKIVHPRKVSETLRGQSSSLFSSKGLELPQAKEVPIKATKAAHEKDEATSSMRVPPESHLNSSGFAENLDPENSTDSEHEDAHRLAADIATDAAAAEPSAPSTEFGDAPIKPVYEMRESKVPSSRFGRIWQYGGLATSMAFGAVGEGFRRASGAGGEAGGSLMLSEANMERLVSKLSRMRGAALKLGQMMSFQDSKMLPKPIHDVLQRVQDSADYMPPSQRNRVLSSNLGPDWRSLFSTFDESPIAAASIGQVHYATLASTSQAVAVKVQYPGVASSIDSDLSNLAILLTASRLLPKGLFLDKTIANARTELAWECDYVREAEMGIRFRDLLADQTETYHVPNIIKEASGSQVLTAEFVEGTGVTKGQHFTQQQKDWIGTNILRLCLREITEFKFMQTDPNWTNFLFNPQTQKLELLDFGASRDFPDDFILPYIRTLLAASLGDRERVRDLSVELGYLTGHDSQAMVNAHVNSVLTLAEPFAETAPELYDFRDQTITDRVRGFIPVMLRERLAPPPEETYSLHRKLSGAFLLCARLGSRVRCREMFAHAMGKAGMI